MRIPEVLVLGDGPDRGAGLRERGRGRGVRQTRAFQRPLDGGVGETLSLEQPRAHRVDVGAGVGANEGGETVQGALPWTAEAGEEMLRKRSRVGGDPLSLIQQTGRLP